VTKISREEAEKRCEAVSRLGTYRAAAREFDMNETALRRSLATAEKHYGIKPDVKLALKGTSILTDASGALIQRWDKTRTAGMDPDDRVHMPDPKTITKISTLYDQQGNVTQQWVAEKPQDAAREKLWREFAAALAADLPRAEPIPVPSYSSTDLCAVYPVGDHHLGMYSWAAETGADYDLDIGEKLLTDSMGHLVASVPQCETALLVVIGDFLHYDSTRAETPLHRNLLDADGRAQKMVQVAVHALRKYINAALQRHPTVRLILEPGNHDPHSMTILSVCMAAIYENEPRLTVDLSPSHFHYFEFGQNLIGTHHGHGVKMDKLPGVMAADQREAWGRTKYHHWLTGHIHHKQFHDFPGCSVESLRILPPIDAYAAQKGYRSARGMSAIVLHREHGEVARHTVNPNMFERAA
jgi:hypothetical protein